MLDLIQGDSILETARLRLEPLTPHHAPDLFPVLSDAQIYTYIPHDPPSDRATLTMRYQQLATRRSPHSDALWLNWAVQRQRERDYIGVVQVTVTADQPAYLAYLLASAYWGSGYAREACGRILLLLFAAYQIHVCGPRSIAVIRHRGLCWNGLVFAEQPYVQQRIISRAAAAMSTPMI
jgi:ribosomal-protein-alanine N-acetyltransferase